MKKPQTDRAKRRRANRNRPTATCPQHGHKVNRHTKYNEAIRFMCGCPTGRRRN